MSSVTPLLASVCVAIREPILAKYIYNYLKEKKGYSFLDTAHHVSDVLKFKNSHKNITLYFDIHLNGIKDIDHAVSITQQVSANQTIVLCYENDIPLIEPLIKLNYSGYILKTSEDYALNNAIKKYRNNRTHTDHLITKFYQQKNALSKQITGPSGKAILTEKEFEIVKLLFDDLKPSQICKRLNVSINTFKTHRKNLSVKIHRIGFHNIKTYLSKQRDMGLE